MGEKIQVVAQYDDLWEEYATFMTGLFLIGEVEVYSVQDLVDKVKAKLGNGGKIDRLEIFAHGSDTLISIGDKDVLHDWRPKVHMPTLARLKPNFDSGGSVILYSCEAGKCTNVLSDLAKTLDVNVYGNTGDIYPNLRTATGDNVVAHPNGSLEWGEAAGEDVFWRSGSDMFKYPWF